MNDTVFLHVETNLNDDSGFPTSIAWSLPDTRIKSVLIIPEEEWLDTYYEYHDATNASLDNNYHQGASCQDIARELEHDLDGKYVYVLNEAEQLPSIERVFQGAQSDMPFEVLPATELFEQTEAWIHEAVEQHMVEQGLDRADSNGIVLALLLAAREHSIL